MDERQPLEADELGEACDRVERAACGPDVVARAPQVGRVQAERQAIGPGVEGDGPDAVEDGGQLLDPRAEPIAATFSTILRRPASRPLPRCDPMCVFTRVAP
jgi:hypothetical protein